MLENIVLKRKCREIRESMRHTMCSSTKPVDVQTYAVKHESNTEQIYKHWHLKIEEWPLLIFKKIQIT